MPPRVRSGFTLIEVSITVAVIAVATALTLPPIQAQLMRSRRADAIAALTRVQMAEEQHRLQFGGYAQALPALQGAAATRSPEGLYEIALQDGSADAVTVAARAVAGGPQAGDNPCQQITLRLNQGMAEYGPDARCWNR